MKDEKRTLYKTSPPYGPNIKEWLTNAEIKERSGQEHAATLAFSNAIQASLEKREDNDELTRCRAIVAAANATPAGGRRKTRRKRRSTRSKRSSA